MPKTGLGTTAQQLEPSPARARRPRPVSAALQQPERQGKEKPGKVVDCKLIVEGEASQQQLQAIFGANLKAARLKSNLKQSEVAARTGLTQQYLSLVEAGQRNITMRTMAILAMVVDHDVLNLLKQALGMPAKQ